MLYKTFYLLSVVFLLSSCQNSPAPVLAPEYLYDAGDQKVISSLINNSKGTIALLYGNELAQQAASDSTGRQLPGARYTMVTWKQKPMPGWYGTNMNSEIYSVETLSILAADTKDVHTGYQFQAGPGYPPGDTKPLQKERISFITAQRRAVRP